MITVEWCMHDQGDVAIMATESRGPLVPPAGWVFWTSINLRWPWWKRPFKKPLCLSVFAKRAQANESPVLVDAHAGVIAAWDKQWRLPWEYSNG